MNATKIILGYSKRTSNAAARAELGIQSLHSGRDARKLTWQYRMCSMGEETLPRIAWKAKWANKMGRQPMVWFKVVEDVWEGLDIDEAKTLKMEGLEGLKGEISVAFAQREKQNLNQGIKDKAGLQVYRMLREEMGFEEDLHGPMDAETKLRSNSGPGALAFENKVDEVIGL